MLCLMIEGVIQFLDSNKIVMEEIYQFIKGYLIKNKIEL